MVYSLSNVPTDVWVPLENEGAAASPLLENEGAAAPPLEWGDYLEIKPTKRNQSRWRGGIELGKAVCRPRASTLLPFQGEGRRIGFLACIGSCPPPSYCQVKLYYSQKFIETEPAHITTGRSWGWPCKARHKRPRSTPIGVRSFVMALKKKK